MADPPDLRSPRSAHRDDLCQRRCQKDAGRKKERNVPSAEVGWMGTTSSNWRNGASANVLEATESIRTSFLVASSSTDPVSFLSQRKAKTRRTTHLDRHREPLQHLVAPHANQVQSDDLLLGSNTDELVRRRFLVVGFHHRVVEGREGRFVDLDLVVSVLCARFGLRLRGGGVRLGKRIGRKSARVRRYRWWGACDQPLVSDELRIRKRA